MECARVHSREKEVRLLFILYSTIPAERRGGSIELLLGSILEETCRGIYLGASAGTSLRKNALAKYQPR